MNWGKSPLGLRCSGCTRIRQGLQNNGAGRNHGSKMHVSTSPSTDNSPRPQGRGESGVWGQSKYYTQMEKLTRRWHKDMSGCMQEVSPHPSPCQRSSQRKHRRDNREKRSDFIPYTGCHRQCPLVWGGSLDLDETLSLEFLTELSLLPFSRIIFSKAIVCLRLIKGRPCGVNSLSIKPYS